jgi:hypothetical protein
MRYIGVPPLAFILLNDVGFCRFRIFPKVMT